MRVIDGRGQSLTERVTDPFALSHRPVRQTVLVRRGRHDDAGLSFADGTSEPETTKPPGFTPPRFPLHAPLPPCFGHAAWGIVPPTFRHV